MSNIVKYGPYFILKEFVNPDEYSITMFSTENDCFYSKSINSNEWAFICPNYTLKEFNLIINECINPTGPGYVMKFQINGERLEINFICTEKIKTYAWSVTLMSISKSNEMRLNEYFTLSEAACKQNFSNFIKSQEPNIDSDQNEDSLIDEIFNKMWEPVRQNNKLILSELTSRKREDMFLQAIALEMSKTQKPIKEKINFEEVEVPKKIVSTKKNDVEYEPKKTVVKKKKKILKKTPIKRGSKVQYSESSETFSDSSSSSTRCSSEDSSDSDKPSSYYIFKTRESKKIMNEMPHISNSEVLSIIKKKWANINKKSPK